jgi:hypothetical protein
MNHELIKNNYIFIDNFIDAKKAKKLYKQFKLDSEINSKLFHVDDQCPISLASYNYKLFIELLIEKISFITNIINEPVAPTYCYSRIYSNGEILHRHRDRAACEISVSLNLGGDKDWDIFFQKPNGEEISLNLKPGQAVIYLGCIADHWRESFTGNHYGQVFLHYVRLNGENWDCYFDRIRA